MSEKWKVGGESHALEPATGLKFTRRPGGWILVEGPGWRKRVAISEARGALSASIGGTLRHGEVQAQSRSMAKGGESADADLTAQFPGKIRKILATVGSTVESGATLLLVEAMKMEFAVKAPFKAKVIKILVQEGAPLAPGDRYLELEEIKAHGKKS